MRTSASQPATKESGSRSSSARRELAKHILRPSVHRRLTGRERTRDRYRHRVATKSACNRRHPLLGNHLESDRLSARHLNDMFSVVEIWRVAIRPMCTPVNRTSACHGYLRRRHATITQPRDNEQMYGLIPSHRVGTARSPIVDRGLTRSGHNSVRRNTKVRIPNRLRRPARIPGDFRDRR